MAEFFAAGDAEESERMAVHIEDQKKHVLCASQQPLERRNEG
jgi:hypothetical protein